VPVFEYSAYKSPYIGTIADLLRSQGDIRASAQIASANAQARALELQGQASANMAQAIGQGIASAAQIPLQVQQAKRLEAQTALQHLQVQAAQHEAAGKQAVAGLMQGSHLGPEDVGPRLPSYLGDDGLFDVPKITARLGELGYGDLAPDLIKGAQSINDSILEHQKLEQQTAQASTVMLGHMANNVQQLVKRGVPLDQAMDLAIQPALATKRIKPQEYAQFKQQFAQLPADQQDAALTALMDEAARLSPTKTVGEGQQILDVFGRVVATGGEKPPTETELALRAARGDPDAIAALNRLKPSPEDKKYQVTVPGPDGKPVTKLFTAAELAQGVATYQAPKEAKEEPIVSVIGADGKPVYVTRAEALGKTPGNIKEQGRPVVSGDANRISELTTALNQADQLGKTVTDPGTVSRIQAWAPQWVTDLTGGWGESAKAQNATIALVRQIIGKGLEGGVLRKEDEEKYKAILPQLGDTKDLVRDKLNGLKQALDRKRSDLVNALEDAGYDVSDFRKRLGVEPAGNLNTGATPAAPVTVGGFRVRVKPG